MESQKENKPKFRPNPSLKLMDQVREVLRYHHYAYRTEQTYCQWILRYIYHFGGKTHPNLLGAKDIERFLSHLATVGKVSASTQKQALNALVFLYRDVLDKPLAEQIAPIRSKRLQRPPTVLIQAEVHRLLAAMTGKHALMAKLLYGGGLRLMECIRLRVQDVDFGQGLIFIRGGKGGKDRTTILPKNLQDELQKQVQAVKTLHHKELEEGFGEVYIPEALARKYPSAATGNRLAMGVSGKGAFHRSAFGQGDAPSCAGIRTAEGGEESGRTSQNRQKSRLPYPPPQFCHAYVGKWGEYPGAPGSSRPCRRQDDRDLHPCHGPRSPQA